MAGFSLSLPATKIALAGLGPWFVASGRAVGAALLAAAYLWLTGAGRPTRPQAWRLAVVAFGVVVGFPLFTTLALTTQTSAHGAVVVAVLPAATAVFAVLRAGERPSSRFWLASGAGLVAVATFTALGGGIQGGLGSADLFLFAGVGLCALGYAEGGALARELGGARTICWALLVALPVTVPVAAFAASRIDLDRVGTTAWAGFGYLSVVSMFLGFVAWYAGLARGGIARVGQVQLAQPVLTIGWSVLLLGETVGAPTIVSALAVLACVVATQRSR